MTAPIDIAALRAICQAATPGPWEVGEKVHDAAVIVRLPDHGTMAGCYQPVVRKLGSALGSYDGQDAAFIAAARTALPELLDRAQFAESSLALANEEIERLRSKLCDRCKRTCPHNCATPPTDDDIIEMRACRDAAIADRDRMAKRLAEVEAVYAAACAWFECDGDGEEHGAAEMRLMTAIAQAQRAAQKASGK